MEWLQQLQPASFRGVGFEVDTSDLTAGDAVVVRDYPFQDVPVVFRMGAAAERIKLAAYVAGTDWQAKRDALRQVLTGEGVLIHPSLGAVRVAVAGAYSLREAPLREGGVARFELEFVRVEQAWTPAPVRNTQGAAADAAEAARATIAAQFAAGFAPAEAPRWVQTSVTSTAKAKLDAVMGAVTGATKNARAVVDGLSGTFVQIRTGLADLVAQPAALAGAVRELLTLPKGLEAATIASLRGAYSALFGLGQQPREQALEQVIAPAPGRFAMMGLGAPDAPVADTAARLLQGTLDAEFGLMLDGMCLAAWVEAIAADDLPSYDDALTWRVQLAQRGRGLMLAASQAQAPAALPTASVHDALAALVAAGLRDLQTRGRDETRLSSYTPTGWMTVWELSHTLYGTAGWADELMATNPQLSNPLLIPPGQRLKVVRHG